MRSRSRHTVCLFRVGSASPRAHNNRESGVKKLQVQFKTLHALSLRHSGMGCVLSGGRP